MAAVKRENRDWTYVKTFESVTTEVDGKEVLVYQGYGQTGAGGENAPHDMTVKYLAKMTPEGYEKKRTKPDGDSGNVWCAQVGNTRLYMSVKMRDNVCNRCGFSHENHPDWCKGRKQVISDDVDLSSIV